MFCVCVAYQEDCRAAAPITLFTLCVTYLCCKIKDQYFVHSPWIINKKLTKGLEHIGLSSIHNFFFFFEGG